MRTRRSHPADEGRLLPPGLLRRHSPSKDGRLSTPYAPPHDAPQGAHESRRSPHRRERDGRDFRALLGSGRTERQQGGERGRAPVRRAPLAKPANDVAIRLIKLAGSRATQDGVIVIFAQSFASQPRNREDARARLTDLLVRAQVRPKRRLATRPTRASRVRRVDEKTRRGAVKALRGKTKGAD